MGFGKITIRPSDRVFSQYVRLRDGQCLRCYSPVMMNAKGLPISHQASHFWGRGKESTRFDIDNVICLCTGCHMYFTAHPEDHRAWQLERMGQKAYDQLMVRANTTGKRDDQMALIVAKQLLASVS